MPRELSLKEMMELGMTMPWEEIPAEGVEEAPWYLDPVDYVAGGLGGFLGPVRGAITRRLFGKTLRSLPEEIGTRIAGLPHQVGAPLSELVAGKLQWPIEHAAAWYVRPGKGPIRQTGNVLERLLGRYTGKWLGESGGLVTREVFPTSRTIRHETGEALLQLFPKLGTYFRTVADIMDPQDMADVAVDYVSKVPGLAEFILR